MVAGGTYMDMYGSRSWVSNRAEVFDFSSFSADGSEGNVTKCTDMPDLPDHLSVTGGNLFQNDTPIICGSIHNALGLCYTWSEAETNWIKGPEMLANNSQLFKMHSILSEEFTFDILAIGENFQIEILEQDKHLEYSNISNGSTYSWNDLTLGTLVHAVGCSVLLPNGKIFILIEIP